MYKKLFVFLSLLVLSSSLSAAKQCRFMIQSMSMTIRDYTPDPVKVVPTVVAGAWTECFIAEMAYDDYTVPGDRIWVESTDTDEDGAPIKDYLEPFDVPTPNPRAEELRNSIREA